MAGYIASPPYNGRTNQCVGCNYPINLRKDFHIMLSRGYLCEMCIQITKGELE